MIQKAIQQVLDGNKDAYRDIMEEYQDMLIAFAGFRLLDADLVDEVVQQTFIRAYEQLDQYRTKEDFGVWLRTICHYIILKEIKSIQRKDAGKKKYKNHISRKLLHLSEEIYAADIDSDIYENLYKCMNKLKERSMKLIQDKYKEQRSIKEIAGLYSKSVTWVTTAMYRIRKQLKDCIEYEMMGEKS